MNSSWSERFSRECNKSPWGCAEEKPCGYRFETHIMLAGDSIRHRRGSREKKCLSDGGRNQSTQTVKITRNQEQEHTVKTTLLS